MEKDWIRIATYGDVQEATIVSDNLRLKGIETVVMDKSVTGFVSAGNVELYCHESNVKRALEILEDANE